MLRLSTLAVVVAALSALDVAEADMTFRFRMAARYLMYARMDPIINPGKIGGHVHQIMGGSRFRDELDSTDTMLTANCSSTAIQHDKSNYWTPTLYFIHGDGTFEPVGSNTLIYYQSDFKNVNTFPPGFRMIAGNAMERNYGAEAFKGIKLEAKNAPANHGPHFVNHTVPDDFRTRIFFPSCGLASQALDSKDHFSHMAYPIHGVNVDWSINGPECPDTHPVVYPQILIETFYSFSDAQKKAWRPNQANLAWSNGDTAGSSYHGDFVNGWDNAALAKFIADGVDSISGKNSKGNNEGQNMMFGMGEKDWNPYDYCRMEGQVPAEDIGFANPIPKLPGCNELWGWDQMTKPKCETQPPAPGYATPNLLFDRGTYNFPVVIPNAGSDLSKLPTSRGNGWTSWPGPVNGTQEAVDAAAKGGPAHPKVIGLDNVPAFFATSPNSVVDLTGKMQSVGKTHSDRKLQCPDPASIGFMPCAPAAELAAANSTDPSAATDPNSGAGEVQTFPGAAPTTATSSSAAAAPTTVVPPKQSSASVAPPQSSSSSVAPVKPTTSSVAPVKPTSSSVAPTVQPAKPTFVPFVGTNASAVGLHAVAPNTDESGQSEAAPDAPVNATIFTAAIDTNSSANATVLPGVGSNATVIPAVGSNATVLPGVGSNATVGSNDTVIPGVGSNATVIPAVGTNSTGLNGTAPNPTRPVAPVASPSGGPRRCKRKRRLSARH